MRRTAAITATAFLLLFGSAITLQAQRGGRGDDKRDGHGNGRDKHDQQQPAPAQPPRVSEQEQQQRIQQEQQRAAQYRTRLDQQVQLAQRQSEALQQQKRAAQYRNQQEYQADLRRQQDALRDQRDYRNDPYVITPANYRYTVGGAARHTNQYGADLLRQAVNYGYQQGYRAGQADRQDRSRFDYRDAYAYRDANYGYNGNYVEQDDYNSYFREGFRRGYEDGFYSRSRYGRVTPAGAAIAGGVLAGILVFAVTR